jgi:hypothetical protein
MSAHQLFVLTVVIAGLSEICHAQTDQSGPVVESVALTADVPLDHGSLEHLLRIRKIVGTFQLSELPAAASQKASSLRLRLDFYRNGKHLAIKAGQPGVGGPNCPRHGQFLVQIVDLDYSKIGEAHPGHWRVFASMMVSQEPKGRGVRASVAPTDILKTEFDAQPSSSRVGRFTVFPYNGDREFPIFYSASGQVRDQPSSLTELLKASPKSDILVGVIEVR